MPCIACERGPADERLEAAVLPAVVQRPVGVDDHVPDLARGPVRAAMELAIDDQAPSDARRPRDVDHVARAPSGPVVELAQSGHVGIIGEIHLRARGPAHERHKRHVLPGQVRWIDQDASLEVDRPGRCDGDAANLFPAAVAVDLARRPVHHRLRGWQRMSPRLDAGDELAVGARERDPDLRSTEIDSGQHGAIRVTVLTRQAGLPAYDKERLFPPRVWRAVELTR